MYRVSLMLALVVAFVLIGCASQQYVPKENEEIYGTWANKDYPSHENKAYPLHGVQKIICSPDGTLETGSMFWDHRGAKRSYAYTIRPTRRKTTEPRSMASERPF